VPAWIGKEVGTPRLVGQSVTPPYASAVAAAPLNAPTPRIVTHWRLIREAWSAIAGMRARADVRDAAQPIRTASEPGP